MGFSNNNNKYKITVIHIFNICTTSNNNNNNNYYYILCYILFHDYLEKDIVIVMILISGLMLVFLPSYHQEWRPCVPSWSWAVASAPLRWTCACEGRRSPVPGRWRGRGQRGPARIRSEPGWSRDLSDWVCHGKRGELKAREREREEEERKLLFSLPLNDHFKHSFNYYIIQH